MDQVFRGITRAELDLAYNNVKAQPDYAGLMAGFHERSRAIYAAFDVKRDIPYGAGPRQRFDWLACGEPNAPVFVFIHGGYWQNYAKEELAFVAQGPLARGFDVALAEYTLAPQASMTQIVGEIRALLDHLASGDSVPGFAGRPVCLCGHSAGGQLAALHRAHPAVSVAVAVSGLFDLEPIARSWLNDKLQLTAAEIADDSPMRQIGRGASTIVPVGTAELSELVRQSADYAEACRAAGETVSYLPLAGRTHFTILQDLATPDSELMNAVVEAMGSASA